MWGRVAAPRIALPSLVLACGAVAVAWWPAAGWASAARAAAGARSGHAAVRGRGRARAAVVGGSLTQVSQASWTAYLFVNAADGAWSCDGVILDDTHILTAAHCLIDDNTGQVAPVGDFYVFTGVSNVSALGINSSHDSVSVARADPSYQPVSDADDVGVLTLTTPLVWSAGVAPISLGPPGGVAPGSGLSVSGFGLEQPPSFGVPPDGTLNSLAMTVAPAGDCVPTFDALIGCANAPAGATCEGDSGSALTSTTAPPVVLGIVDAGEVDQSNNDECQPGFTTFFAKVTVPEIADFIDDVPDPDPPAPQGGADVSCQNPSTLRPGDTITCDPGTWTNSPTLTDEFVDDATGAVLQTGSTSYQVAGSDVGRQIYFLVEATNAGGTAASRTGDAPTVQPPLPTVLTTTTPPNPVNVTTTTTSQTIVPAVKPATARPSLQLYAGARSVSPRARLAFRVVLSSGAPTLTRAQVCATAPAGTSVVPAAGAQVRGRRLCWTLSLRPGNARTTTFSVRVGAHARRGTLTATATATAPGLRPLSAVVHVALT
jgi:hypothetical protein